MKKHHGDVFSIIPVCFGAIFLIIAVASFLNTTPDVPTGTIAYILPPTITPQPSLTKSPATWSTPTPTTTYRPVKWMELVSFISDDHTNWNTYIPNQYVCLDFAIDLVENATKQNIKAWIVAVDFTDGGPGHSFTAFETTDRGVVFIEPQADIPYINPKVGQDLCDSWNGTMCMGVISKIEYL
jgi:hypothetical protein